MKFPVWIIAVFLFMGPRLGAIELTDLFRAALDADRELAGYRKGYEKAALARAFTTRDDPIALSVGTGSEGIGYYWSWNEDRPGYFYLTPSLSVNFGGKLKTQTDLAMPLTVTMGSGGSTSMEFNLTVRQPLNELVGLYHANDLAATRAWIDLERARIQVLDRTFDVQIRVLNLVQAVCTAEGARLLAAVALRQAKRDRLEIERLKTYAAGSPEYRLADIRLERAEIGDRKSAQAVAAAYASLGDFCVMRVDALPDPPDSRSVALPGPADVSRNADVYLAGLEDLLARESLRQDVVEYPAIDLLFRYRDTAISAGQIGQQNQPAMSGGVSVSIAGFSISASAGRRLKEDRVFATLGIDWTMPDFGKDAFDRATLERNVEAVAIALDRATKAYAASLTDFVTRRDQGLLDMRTAELDCEEASINASLEEKRLAAGLSDELTADAAKQGLAASDRLLAAARYSDAAILLGAQKLVAGGINHDEKR
jgi:hypothetical protein